jgi:hypothetical protein
LFGVVIVISVPLLLIKNHNNSQQANFSPQVKGESVPKTLTREKPSFRILYPGNKSEETVGEIVKNSPPGSAGSYVYTDQIGSVPIKVSQQELPKNFKDNQDAELSKLAKDFQANEVIQVDSIKVYHGSSASGVQSLILIKGNLLILIAASQALGDEAWAAYVSALH